MLVHDLEGRVLEVNHIAGDMLGLEADELIGINMREIESPGGAGPLRRRLDFVLRTGSYHGRTTFMARDGTVTPVEVRCLLVEREGAPAVLCLTRKVREIDMSDTVLQESQDPCALALDAVSDGVWDHDFRTKRFRRNEHWYRLIGFAPGELEAWEAEHGTIIHPDDVGRLGEAWLRCETGRSDFFRAEVRLRHRSGQWRWILGRGRVIERGPNGEPWRMIGTDTDITDQKQVEEALRESEEKYRLISENIPVVVYSALPDEHSTNLFMSGRIEELTGYAEREFMEDPTLWGRIIHADDTERVWQAIAEHRRARAPLDVEYRIITRDGQMKWIRDKATPMLDEGGEIVRINGFMEDITQRRQAEDALRMTQFAVDNAVEAALWVATDARFIYVNDAACRSLGYTRDELLAMTVHDIDPNFPKETWAAHWVKVRARKSFTLETVHRAKDGRIIPVEITVNYIEFGGREYNVAFARDITARKQAEAERRQLEAQMQHAQKLESLGVLAGGIAHDFNNLLAAILGNADLALLQLPADEPAQACIEEIKTVARHAGHLTRQMLAYSGKGQLLVKPVSLNEQIDGMTHLLQASVTKKAAVHLDLARELPLVEADPAQIQQVVMNLLTNASDALGDGPGTIGIRTGVLEADRARLSSGYPAEGLIEGRYVFVEVSDTGFGMDANTKARMFEPFFTTKFTGRGLGLAAVLGIVRGHGGTILVESTPGKGTTFTVLFPCSEVPLEETPPAAPPAGPQSGTGTVLIVDDERPVREVARRILEHAGFAARTAAAAVEGIEHFRAHADEIDAVLLDMTMPELSGEEVFRELRRIRPGVRVVLTSGYTEQDALCRFNETGLAGFISKPFDADTLIAKMQDAIRA